MDYEVEFAVNRPVEIIIPTPLEGISLCVTTGGPLPLNKEPSVEEILYLKKKLEERTGMEFGFRYVYLSEIGGIDFNIPLYSPALGLVLTNMLWGFRGAFIDYFSLAESEVEAAGWTGGIHPPSYYLSNDMELYLLDDYQQEDGEIAPIPIGEGLIGELASITISYAMRNIGALKKLTDERDYVSVDKADLQVEVPIKDRVREYNNVDDRLEVGEDGL